MKKMIIFSFILFFQFLVLSAQNSIPNPVPEPTIIRPEPIDIVLTNPGKGFMTFQRFNGDTMNTGREWTEGYPIVYQDWQGNMTIPEHPHTSIAYFRIYWTYVEPKNGQYNWAMFDKALETAESRGQTLMLRIAPYGGPPHDIMANPADVPTWYRKIVGDKKLKNPKWMIDHNDPRFVKYWVRLIEAFAKRYNGHHNIEAVDISFCGAWGESAGVMEVMEEFRHKLMDAYLDNFTKTQLTILLDRKENADYCKAKVPNIGFRADCLGDIGIFGKRWNHMHDYFPQAIYNTGLSDQWTKGPVTFEVCGVLQTWYENGFDIDYVIDQSLKWHISSFNSKSSHVPPAWQESVDRWIKSMGYRFVMRRFEFIPQNVAGGTLNFTSWSENKGVAPCYQDFLFTLRLRGGKDEKETFLMETKANIGTWMPGDIVYDDSVTIAENIPEGWYYLEYAIIHPQTKKPVIQFANWGKRKDGWYQLERFRIVNE